MELRPCRKLISRLSSHTSFSPLPPSGSAVCTSSVAPSPDGSAGSIPAYQSSGDTRRPRRRNDRSPLLTIFAQGHFIRGVEWVGQVPAPSLPSSPPIHHRPMLLRPVQNRQQSGNLRTLIGLAGFRQLRLAGSAGRAGNHNGGRAVRNHPPLQGLVSATFRQMRRYKSC